MFLAISESSVFLIFSPEETKTGREKLIMISSMVILTRSSTKEKPFKFLNKLTSFLRKEN